MNRSGGGGATYMYMPRSYWSYSCLPVWGTMAGWGIPVGCMPDGPSIREWGNLVEVKEGGGGERGETQMNRSSDKVLASGGRAERESKSASSVRSVSTGGSSPELLRT